MTKKEARQQVKEWMKKLDKNYIEKADQSIFEQVKELKEFQEAKTIFCYASMKNEVDTWQGRMSEFHCVSGKESWK